MKKIAVALLVLMFISLALATLDPSANDSRSTFRNGYQWGGHALKDKATIWAQAVENSLDGTLANNNLLFSQLTSDPTSTAGRIYYNTTIDKFKFYNDTAWVTFGVNEASDSLDDAYNGGAAISVDSGAVTLTASDAASNTVFALVQSDTGTAVGMTITNAGTGNTIDIQNAQAGTDIEGTDDTWNVATTGVGTFLSFVLENGEIISNAVNDKILFNTGDEDLLIDFTTLANGLVLTANSTGATIIDFGDFVTLQAMSTIAFEPAAAAITLTADAGTEDLTISQAGAVDASLILTSAGTSTTDAMIITTSTGTIDMNSADNLDIDVADNITIDTAGGSITTTLVGGDFDLDATNASINLDAGEAVANAIVIDASNAGGGIDIDAGTASIDIDVTGGDFTVDNDGAGKDITLTSDAGRVILKAEEAANNAITFVSVAGGIDADAALSIVITSSEEQSDAIEIAASGTAGGVTIDSGTGDITLTSTDDIVLTNATAVGDMIQLLNTAGTSVTENSAAIQVTATAGGIQIQSDAAIDGDVIILRADGGVTNDILIHNDQGTGLDCIDLQADAGGVTITAALPVVITNAFELPVVYLASNDATLTILANDSGQTHIFPDIDADTVVTLPTAAAGLRYHFVYAGGAEDAHDWSIETGNNTNFYLGGVVTHDDDDGDTVVYFSDESDDSKISILTPSAGTTIDIWCDGTNWWITGNIVSGTDTSVVFSQI